MPARIASSANASADNGVCSDGMGTFDYVDAVMNTTDIAVWVMAITSTLDFIVTLVEHFK